MRPLDEGWLFGVGEASPKRGYLGFASIRRAPSSPLPLAPSLQGGGGMFFP